MSSLNRAIWTVLLAGALLGCRPSGHEQEVLVFAAASLADALGEVEKRFEAGSEIRLSFSYGASQMLAQQIASGAPADVFISAGDHPVKFLTDRGKIDTVGSDLLVNRLVVAARSSPDFHLKSIGELNSRLVERIAVADPELAPAGRYAREALTTLGLWDEIQPKLVFGADVRATLTYVEYGNADAALVYVTDARAARKVQLLDIVPPDSYSRVRYPVAIVSGSTRAGVLDFVSFLEGQAARDIFRKHGFELPD